MDDANRKSAGSTDAKPKAGISVDALTRQWLNGLRIAHIAHNQCAARCERFGRLIGVTSVVLSAIVGTAIFASLSSVPNIILKIGTGLLSVGAAALMALHTFLNYAERAERHRKSAVAYGSLRRALEERIMSSPDDREVRTFLHDLRARWDSADADAPGVPQAVHYRVLTRVIPSALPSDAGDIVIRRRGLNPSSR